MGLDYPEFILCSKETVVTVSLRQNPKNKDSWAGFGVFENRKIRHSVRVS